MSTKPKQISVTLTKKNKTSKDPSKVQITLTKKKPQQRKTLHSWYT